MKTTTSDTRKFPLGTIAVYGPNNELATKLVVGVFKHKDQNEPEALQRWFSSACDVRNDPVIGGQVTDFLKQHGVTQTVMADRIIGCPHEEGVDYPIGEACPQCPFWADKNRFTHEPVIKRPKTGRNDPCLCGSGKKFKKCCGG